jgi:hypothetical protein
MIGPNVFIYLFILVRTIVDANGYSYYYFFNFFNTH